MPTYREEDPEKIKQLRDEENAEREFLLEQLKSKKEHDLAMTREKNKSVSDGLKITHRATSRASIWRTLFTIIPKCILIFLWFWLIVLRREVPKSWGEFLSS